MTRADLSMLVAVSIVALILLSLYLWTDGRCSEYGPSWHAHTDLWTCAGPSGELRSRP